MDESSNSLREHEFKLFESAGGSIHESVFTKPNESESGQESKLFVSAQESMHYLKCMRV